MSGKLSTKEVKTGGEGGLPKTIQPSNVKAQILSIRLDQPEFLKKENGYFLVMEMETTKPELDFVGFLLNKELPDGGNHEGQVGKVKSSNWSYRDGKTPKGIEISRDNEIMKFVKNLCESMGMMQWWDDSDEKFDTIEQFIEAFNQDKPFKGKFIDWCIGGREYQKKDSEYKGYDLYLPKFSKDGAPFKGDHETKKKLLVYDADKHIIIEKEKEVPGFTGEGKDPMEDTPASNNAAPKPPEFEL